MFCNPTWNGPNVWHKMKKKKLTLLDGPEFWILANTHTCEVYPVSIGRFEVRMPIFAAPLDIFKATCETIPPKGRERSPESLSSKFYHFY